MKTPFVEVTTNGSIAVRRAKVVHNKAHTLRGCELDMGTLKMSPERSFTYPEAICSKSHRYIVKRGTAQDTDRTDRDTGERYKRQLRLIPDSYIEKLEQIDAEIERLREEERDLILEAARHGRPVKVSDVQHDPHSHNE